MKVRVSVDRQSGPVIGSRLDYDCVIPEPAVEEIRIPNFGPTPTPGERQEIARCTRRRELFVQELAAIFARSVTKGLDEALDGRAQTY